MSKTINIRLTDELKEDADQLFDDIGISISEAVRVFLKQAVNCGGFPFTPHGRTPNATTIKSFKEVDDNVDSRTYNNFSDLLQDENIADL